MYLIPIENGRMLPTGRVEILTVRSSDLKTKHNRSAPSTPHPIVHHEKRHGNFGKTLHTRTFSTGKFFGTSTHGILTHSWFRQYSFGCWHWQWWWWWLWHHYISTLHAIFLCSWDLEICHRVATPKCCIWELLHLRIAPFEKCSIWELLHLRIAPFEKCWIWELSGQT